MRGSRICQSGARYCPIGKHVSKPGHGQTILMVHGAFSAGWAFEKFEEFFQARGYRCIVPDLRHHDIAPRHPPDPALGNTSLLDYLSDLQEIIAGLDTQPILMGHSMGGLLCQMLAVRGHGAGAILLAPSPPAGILPSSPFEMLSAAGVLASGIGWGQTVMPDYYVASQHSLDHLPKRQQREIFERLVPESGYAMHEMLCWILDPHQAARVDTRKVKCPVLAISGTLDPINPPATVRQIAKRYGTHATYRDFQRCSHWLIEGPRWREIAEYCADWLDENLPRENASDTNTDSTSAAI